MKRTFFLALTLAIAACAPQAATEDFTEETVLFSDVLAEYQALNTRLENVAAPLLRANAELCPRTSRDIGITVHTVTDYPSELQSVARSLIGVTDELSVRTVRTNSTAATAGLKPGDQITRIGGSGLKDTSQAYFTQISQDAFKASETEIEVVRGSKLIKVTVDPETICGYPIIVFFNENMNGHTDGKDVLITSEFMRQVPDDVNLALIVSHELSHAIAGHVDQIHSKALELEADRMALVLMARAGFDIDQAVAYWRDAPHPYNEASKLHPSARDRYENFMQSKTRIQAKQKMGLPLTLSP